MNPIRGRDRGLQLFPVNQESLVGASHKLVSIKSLPFVHTARRYYRLNVLVRSSDCWLFAAFTGCSAWREDDQTDALRGSKSRNKVSVGEPAEGSLQVFFAAQVHLYTLLTRGVCVVCCVDRKRVIHSAVLLEVCPGRRSGQAFFASSCCCWSSFGQVLLCNAGRMARKKKRRSAERLGPALCQVSRQFGLPAGRRENL